MSVTNDMIKEDNIQSFHNGRAIESPGEGGGNKRRIIKPTSHTIIQMAASDDLSRKTQNRRSRK